LLAAAGWALTQSILRGVVAAIREAILSAAEECIRVHGMARVTTKDIARHAGCSEGSIYNHFEDKLDLLSAVISARLPDLMGLVGAMAERAGSGTVQENLAEVMQRALQFFGDVVPLMGSMFGDPQLLCRYQATFVGENGGPPHSVQAVVDYLRAEQRLGRVKVDADPEAATVILLGACYEYALIQRLTGRPPFPAGRMEAVLELLCAGLGAGDADLTDAPGAAGAGSL
jgi:AcrR family transcriptional regulator